MVENEVKTLTVLIIIAINLCNVPTPSQSTPREKMKQQKDMELRSKEI